MPMKTTGDNMKESHTKTQKLIAKLEDEILIGHLTSDKTQKKQKCLHCGNESGWHEILAHSEDCPVMLLRKLRQQFNVPNYMNRIHDKWKDESLE